MLLGQFILKGHFTSESNLCILPLALWTIYPSGSFCSGAISPPKKYTDQNVSSRNYNPNKINLLVRNFMDRTFLCLLSQPNLTSFHKVTSTLQFTSEKDGKYQMTASVPCFLNSCYTLFGYIKNVGGYFEVRVFVCLKIKVNTQQLYLCPCLQF